MKPLSIHIVATLMLIGPGATAHTDPHLPAKIAEALAFGNVVRANVARLVGGEREAVEAFDKLKSLPRAQVVAILREDFHAYPVPSVALLRAITQLQLNEMEPELRALALKSDAWPVFRALNAFGPSREINKVYLQRLAGWSPAPVVVAMLDGLSGVALSAALFDRLLGDSSPDVRRAAWSQFLTSRASVVEIEQARRLKVALSAKPYHVRESAFRNYRRFPASVRGLVSLPACRDVQARVREACAGAQK